MLKAVLFDLDSTLIDYDSDVFFEAYMKLIGSYMAAHVPPERFLRQLGASIEVVVRNRDPRLTNRDVFEADFFTKLGLAAADLRPVFDRFYAERFPQLREVVRAGDTARRVVEAALARGWDIVLATNPIFPRAAIEERMRWIGIDDLPWTLVTVYEEMHFCKPNLEYFQEIMTLIGRQPHECLMVGNDPREDMAARHAGLWTYLAEDNITERGADGYVPHLRGRLADLVALFADERFSEVLQRAGE